MGKCRQFYGYFEIWQIKNGSRRDFRDFAIFLIYFRFFQGSNTGPSDPKANALTVRPREQGKEVFEYNKATNFTDSLAEWIKRWT